MVASVYRTTAMIVGPRAFIARIVYKSGRKLVCDFFETAGTWSMFSRALTHAWKCANCRKPMVGSDRAWIGRTYSEAIYCAECGDDRWSNPLLRVPTHCVVEATRLSWWTLYTSCPCSTCAEQRHGLGLSGGVQTQRWLSVCNGRYYGTREECEESCKGSACARCDGTGAVWVERRHHNDRQKV